MPDVPSVVAVRRRIADVRRMVEDFHPASIGRSPEAHANAASAWSRQLAAMTGEPADAIKGGPPMPGQADQ